MRSRYRQRANQRDISRKHIRQRIQQRQSIRYESQTTATVDHFSRTDHFKKVYEAQWAKLGANPVREAVEKVEVWLYEYFNDAFKKESDITDATIIN
jgi:hypothetical protein